ncbi:MAG: hypothetical protein AABO41_06670 [Acidobacteriota bacterium]
MLAKVASAQQAAPLPPFNQPVSCPDGLSYIVESCQPWGPDERCVFRSERNGELVNRASTWRAMLSERLKDCKAASRPAAGTQTQPARPGAGSAQSMNPPYLSKLPTVERVMRDVQGKDPMDTAARQAGVLWQLREVIVSVATSQRRNELNLTPDEQHFRGEYYAASTRLMQSVQQQLAGDKTGRLFELQGYAYDRKLLDEVLQKSAPGFRDEYWQAEGQIAGRIKAREERDKADQQRAQAEIKEWEAKQQPKPWQRELTRCIASGRSESQCFTEALGKGAGDFLPGLKKIPRPSGLYLSGVYTSQGGFAVMFHSDGAWVGCKQVKWLPASAAVEIKSDQINVRLMSGSGAGCFLCDTQAGAILRQPKPGENPEEWQGQRIIFPVRPDGKLAATRVSPQPSGAVDVTGPVQVGTRPGTKTFYRNVNGIDVYDHTESCMQPVYETQTARCTLGPMTPDQSASAGINVSDVLGSVLGVANKTATKPPPVGFRVHGKYAGEDGFDIEFHPESAVLGCRDAAVAREYSVSTSGNRVLVNIQNGASPIALELRPDGTMAGSGTVQVNGRRLVNVKERIEGTLVVREPVFQPLTDTCTLSVLTPAEGARASGAATASTSTTASTASAAAPTRTPAAATGTRPNVAAGPAGTGTLSVASGIPPEPGDDSNPLDGASFILAKESFESVLRKAGLQPPSGGSALKLWAMACDSKQQQQQQLCQQGFAKLMAVGVGRVKLDAKGRAQFPALPAGTYYLVGSALYDDGPLLWDLRIDIKPGATSVTVDQRNAAPIN